MKRYITASVHGMCGGVFSALRILSEVLDARGEVYVLRELVHNRAVTEELTASGVHFVNDIELIPDGAAVVIGAHGVPVEVEAVLQQKSSFCRDATCPLVKKLHRIAAALTPDQQLVICGKSGHPEVSGIAGNSGTKDIFIVPDAAAAAALPELSAPVFISQTTVDHQDVKAVCDILKSRFPQLKEYSGICDASLKRQNAVIELAARSDLILVIGSAHSSNAKRLREIAQRHNVPAFLIDSAADLPLDAVQNCSTVGITSGASTPEHLVTGVIDALKDLGFSS